jgi:hypothetical protein
MVTVSAERGAEIGAIQAVSATATTANERGTAQPQTRMFISRKYDEARLIEVEATGKLNDRRRKS